MAENTKRKREKEVQIVFDKNGDPLINLDEPIVIKAKSPQNFFPFTNLMQSKEPFFLKVLEELKKNKRVPNHLIPFDIFVVDIVRIDEEKEENKDSE